MNRVNKIINEVKVTHCPACKGQLKKDPQVSGGVRCNRCGLSYGAGA